MIIIRLLGGLGNQLYQYSFYQRLLMLGKDVKMDASYYDEKCREKDKREFDLALFSIDKNAFATEKETRIFIDEKYTLIDRIRRRIFGCKTKKIEGDNLNFSQLLELKEGYLQGYFNSEEMVTPIIPLLQKILIFPDIKNSQNYHENKQILDQILSCDAISLHIRRGDYLKEENQKLFGNICTEKYYENAILMIKKKYENPIFFVFTEDDEYAKNQFQGKEFIVVDHNKGVDSIYDMYLMSKCQSNICANSTFSIWAARLNINQEKIMIRPKLDHNEQTLEEIGVELKNKNGWTLLDKAGVEIVINRKKVED